MLLTILFYLQLIISTYFYMITTEQNDNVVEVESFNTRRLTCNIVKKIPLQNFCSDAESKILEEFC